MTCTISTDAFIRTYALLAGAIDILHATAMILWGVGLPLLIYHRHRFAQLYLWYALSFAFVSFASHELIGECFLTTAARELRIAAGEAFTNDSFSVRLVEYVAGIRPRERTAVVLWEAAIVATCLGALFSMRRQRIQSRPQNRGTAHHATP